MGQIFTLKILILVRLFVRFEIDFYDSVHGFVDHLSWDPSVHYSDHFTTMININAYNSQERTAAAITHFYFNGNANITVR